MFFAEAQRFIRECAAKKQPFLAYIAPNAPHGPLHAPQKYLDLYSDQPPAIAAFFGMISNIDDNVGATRALLRELRLERDTLFIFTTDNGTATGCSSPIRSVCAILSSGSRPPSCPRNGGW